MAKLPIMDMLKTAHEYVQSKRGKWPQFCDAHGFAYDWLTKFAQGRIPDPRYGKVKRLYDLAQLEGWKSGKTINQ